MSLAHSLRITVFAGFTAALAAGCGGLRQAPLQGDDGGTAGIGGSSAGAGRGGGGAGGSGTGGSGTGGSGMGTGGSLVTSDAGGGTDAAFDAGSNDATFVEAGGIDVPVSNCVAGGACVPANPCHKGMFVCSEGAMTCMELADLQANGTVCGANMVCRNGSCGACTEGMACDVTGRPCRVGTIVCTTGAPVCTETDNKPNGTMCGTGMVCQAGTCATCQMGGACTPTNRCHTGMLNCSGAAPVCNDSGSNVPAGTMCGTDMVCGANGTCAACVAGMICNVPNKPCRRGTIACNTGTPVCIESSDAPNGLVCGTNMVCQSGSCSACTVGANCQPTNACHAGVTVCSPTIDCTDTGQSFANGTVCGTDRVCNGGTCVMCAAGTSCMPTNPCKTGATSCVTGSSVCQESGNRPNGSSCGANMVCSNGTCTTCASGSACPPANPCHMGTLDCSTGSAVCNDSGSNHPNGYSCGTNLVCNAGTCVSCTAGTVCQPNNTCKNGTTSCMTGTMTCMETTNRPAGTPCGTGVMSCTGGVLTLPGACNASGTCVAATMTCPSGTCNAAGTDCATCPAGQTSCPAGCRDLQRDPLNCGQCGMVCPMPAGGTGIAVCVSGQCGVSCNPGYLACTAASGMNYAMCQQAMWDFEDMMLGGFRILTSPSAAEKVGYSGQVSHTGKYTFGVLINATGGIGTPTRYYRVGQALCDGNGYVRSKYVTAWMMLQPDDERQTFGPKSFFGLHVYTDRGDFIATGEPKGYYEWFPVSVLVDGNLQAISFDGYFEPTGAAAPSPWAGYVWIDDITID